MRAEAAVGEGQKEAKVKAKARTSLSLWRRDGGRRGRPPRAGASLAARRGLRSIVVEKRATPPLLHPCPPPLPHLRPPRPEPSLERLTPTSPRVRLRPKSSGYMGSTHGTNKYLECHMPTGLGAAEGGLRPHGLMAGGDVASTLSRAATQPCTFREESRPRRSIF